MPELQKKGWLGWIQDYSVGIAWSLAFFALIVNATILYRNFKNVTDNFNEVMGQYESLIDLNLLLETIIDAETGQRGFIITAEEKYLEPYQTALNKVDQGYAKLKNHFASNATQIAKLDEVKRMMDKKLAEMQRTLDLRKLQGFEAAQKGVREDMGKTYMDEFRKLIGEIASQERDLIDQRIRTVEENRFRALITFVSGNIVLTGMVLAVFLVVRRQLRYRHSMTTQLKQLNEELEQRVEHRTEALRATNESLLDEINERARLEEQAVKFARELERSNKELEQFASVASHDLQEPLRKIQAFGDRLQSRYAAQLDDPGKEFLERIQSSAGRMRRLIEDLLAFSRIATRGKPFAPVDLNKVIQGVLSDLEERLQESQGKVEVDPLPTIQADELQMRQLFQNLIGNGLKFHRQGVPPVIRVQSRIIPPIDPQTPEHLELTISDNGIGFENQYADRIFQLFQRLHGRTEYEGTGMGLAICRKIAEHHGGTIHATGQPGAGSVFTVSIPVILTENTRIN